MNTTKEKFKIRLGIFVIAGTVLFVLAIFIIGRQRNLFDPVFRLTTTFFSVSGLQIGNNVRFSGINVGIVDRIIILNDSSVQVDMLIKESVRPYIKKDAKVAIGSEGIIGDRLLLISQGSRGAIPIEKNQMLFSVEPVETDELIASLEITTRNVEIISGQIAGIMSDINNGKGTLGKLIQDSIIVNNLNQIILDIANGKGTIGKLIQDPAIASNLNQIILDIKNGKGTLGQLIEDPAIANQVNQFLLGINNDQGTIGLLVQDTTIANNLSSVMINLKSSSEGLDQNMEAIRHNILLRGYFKRKERDEQKKKRINEGASE